MCTVSYKTCVRYRELEIEIGPLENISEMSRREPEMQRLEQLQN
jgi:hypothetical protein